MILLRRRTCSDDDAGWEEEDLRNVLLGISCPEVRES